MSQTDASLSHKRDCTQFGQVKTERNMDPILQNNALYSFSYFFLYR